MYETIANIALDFGAAIARNQIVVLNSQELTQAIIGYAEEFERRWKGTNWDVAANYIDQIEVFTAIKIAEWKNR